MKRYEAVLTDGRIVPVIAEPIARPVCENEGFLTIDGIEIQSLYDMSMVEAEARRLIKMRRIGEVASWRAADR